MGPFCFPLFPLSFTLANHTKLYFRYHYLSSHIIAHHPTHRDPHPVVFNPIQPREPNHRPQRPHPSRRQALETDWPPFSSSSPISAPRGRAPSPPTAAASHVRRPLTSASPHLSTTAAFPPHKTATDLCLPSVPRLKLPVEPLHRLLSSLRCPRCESRSSAPPRCELRREAGHQGKSVRGKQLRTVKTSEVVESQLMMQIAVERNQ